VIDLTGPEPLVLREGAVSAEEALRVVASVLDG
jgi:tRNA A37 threonylcarbamoyladenosine synthetase subunit TsaC/SUA5/YrdC